MLLKIINLKILSSNKFTLSILILLIVSSIVFQNLPNNIYQNMLDLSFGFNTLDVQKTFDNLGERGRMNYIYSSLILDTVFPILYVLFFISILLKLNEKSPFILYLPLIAGLFDIGENIFISLMMSSASFNNIPESQIFFGSLFNQFKWILCGFGVGFILFKFILNKFKIG